MNKDFCASWTTKSGTRTTGSFPDTTYDVVVRVIEKSGGTDIVVWEG